MFGYAKNVVKFLTGLTVLSSVSFVEGCEYGPMGCDEGQGYCLNEKILMRCMQDEFFEIDCSTDGGRVCRDDATGHGECVLPEPE